MSSVACNWALSDSSIGSAPNAVQLFTIGEISSNEASGKLFRERGLRWTGNCHLRTQLGFRLKSKGGQMLSTESLGDVVVIHPLDPEDGSAMVPIRAAGRTQKGLRWRIDARKQFDALMEGVSPPDDVTFESATVGDVPGLWVHPASSRPDEAIRHLPGGWVKAGSGKAFRPLGGHHPKRSGSSALTS